MMHMFTFDHYVTLFKEFVILKFDCNFTSTLKGSRPMTAFSRKMETDRQTVMIVQKINTCIIASNKSVLKK